MTKVAFTKAQADHALKVVLDLMKKRRFFLYKPAEDGYSEMGIDARHHLDEKTFAQAIDLDAKIRAAYQDVRKDAELSIMTKEVKLGVVPAALQGNKQLVRCNRYTGGLDIFHVLPVSEFEPFFPKSEQQLFDELCIQLRGADSEADLSWNKLHAIRSKAEDLAQKIWTQFCAMKKGCDLEKACVVLLRSRFEPDDKDKNDDFMFGKVWKMQKFPHVVGYLVYRFSQKQRLVQDGFITCSTSRKSHVVIEHSIDEKPTIGFDKRGGYTCSVRFATIM